MFSRMRYLVLLLALSGCAGGLQAFDAPGVPAPVFTPVGAGAPILGQPGQHRSPPVLPPSPNKRILPATREPGIWAADETRAARDKADKEPVSVLDVPLPAPDGKASTRPVRACKAMIDTGLVEAGLKENLAALPQNVRRCVVARLLEACLRTKGKKELARDEQAEARLYYESFQVARAWWPVACKDIDYNNDDLSLIYDEVTSSLKRQINPSDPRRWKEVK